jgi:SNF family Na+-dependent transporter
MEPISKQAIQEEGTDQDMVAPIILICAACMLCGMMVIYTTYILDTIKHLSLEYGYIGLGMFFIIIGGWGIRKEYRDQEEENNRYIS